MIGFNSNFDKNNLNGVVINSNTSQNSVKYCKPTTDICDSAEFTTKKQKKEGFISRLFKPGKHQKNENNQQVLNYNLSCDFGNTQRLKAEEIGESTAKSAIIKAFAEGNDNLNYQLLADDEYDRIREHGIYKVDYGKDAFSSNEEYLLNSIAGFDPGEDFYNVKKYNLNGKDIAEVKVIPLNNWCWRNGAGGVVSDRVSLNIKPEGDFINELDIFMKTGIYTDANGKPSKVEDVTNFFYKTPLDVNSWNDRQDPVTIYFRSNPNNETYKAITDISSRYARGFINNGNKNAPWISNIEKEPDDILVNNLIEELGKYSQRASSALKNTYIAQSKALSSGQYKAYMNILSYIKAAAK